MICRYFTAEEDRAFTASVLEYNDENCTDERRAMMEKGIRDRTALLLYLIPMRNLAVKEEDASAFLLDMQKDISWIISSFRPTGASYNAYLTQLCRFRAMRFQREKSRNERMENAMLFSDPTIFEPAVSEHCVPYSADADGSRIMRMDMKETASYIVRDRGRSSMALSNKEKQLSDMLVKPQQRRQFISYILALPQTESPGFIAGISRLLRTDIVAVSHLYTLRHEFLEMRSGKTIRTLEDVSGRHWKVMMQLRQAIWSETDGNARKVLTEKYRKLSGIYSRRRIELGKARAGMSHKEIALIFGVSRSAVSYGIKRMRLMIEAVAGGL